MLCIASQLQRWIFYKISPPTCDTVDGRMKSGDSNHLGRIKPNVNIGSKLLTSTGAEFIPSTVRIGGFDDAFLFILDVYVYTNTL